jgi:eukaryotic-like serine/threonine-protein kinase
MRNENLESRIRDFEQTWRLTGPCDLADFLDRPTALEVEERNQLLIELVCVDLEFRWQACSLTKLSNEWAFLEHYAARYPELGSLDKIPIEVVSQEYRVRCQWGDRPSHSDFLSRFITRLEQVRVELTRIDSELREESVIPRARALRLEVASALEADQDQDVQFMSIDDILIKRMIGAGRTGKVYEAWQHGTNRLVAVKFLRKSFLRQPRVIQRFIGEAGIIARLRHPNIVGLNGLGRTPGGGYFIVMELVAGSNLDFVIGVGHVPVTKAVQWTIEVCNGLEHAHSKGVIHCDLKPANLLLDGDGHLRITDFGLARSLTEQTPWTAEIEGTAPFMAPEQASRHWGRIDERTDVYGVGAVLFTLLTGRPPWIGRRLPDVLADVVSAAPVISPARLRPDLPESISNVCRRSLSKAPEERYHTIHDVRSALTENRGSNHEA